MLLLLYFDKIIGPNVLIAKPEDVIKTLSKEELIQIKSLLDAGNDGFFTHDFSPELRTANWIFQIPSEWARGRFEIVMLTIIIQQEIEIKEYKQEMENFINKFEETEDIFKAFYLDANKPKEISHIKNKYALLDKWADNLYTILSLKTIETEGELLSFEKFQENQELSVPGGIIINLEKKMREKKNLFVVHRVRGDALKIDVIPVLSREIFKLEVIFGTQMTPTNIKEISDFFVNYDISIVFTSGICQEEDKCIYEVYVELKNIDEFKRLKKELLSLKGIIEIRTEKFSL